MSRFICLTKNHYVNVNQIARLKIVETGCSGSCELKLYLNRFNGTVFDYCKQKYTGEQDTCSNVALYSEVETINFDSVKDAQVYVSRNIETWD